MEVSGGGSIPSMLSAIRFRQKLERDDDCLHDLRSHMWVYLLLQPEQNELQYFITKIVKQSVSEFEIVVTD
jgi:hypothetical protein